MDIIVVQVFGCMALGCLGGRSGLNGHSVGLWVDGCVECTWEAHNERWRLTVVMVHTRG